MLTCADVCCRLVQERDQLQAELARYYGLPNPVGVGMLVEFRNAEAPKTHKLLDPRDDDVVFIPRASASALRYSDLVDGPVLMVTGLVDGLSAALSDAVEVGDMVCICVLLYVSSYYCI